jgi:hypothetical protein
MKNVLFSFTALSILTATFAAHAETSYLPTQEYVDTGLRAVHNQSKERDNALQNDIDELTIYVGAPAVGDTPATGLTKQIDDLNTAIDIVRQDTVYTGDGTGILVTDDRKVGITGLSPATGTNNRMYVFKNNMATELEIADTWIVGSVAMMTPTPNIIAPSTPAQTPTTTGTGEGN